MKVEIDCYEVVDKDVKSQTSAGVIYVPKSWVGKQVRVCRLEPLKDPITESEE